MTTQTPDIRWSDIDLLAVDCDGILTDGGVYMDSSGVETRRFHIHDGQGLKNLMKSGVQVAIISAAKAPSIAHRGKQLGIVETHTGVSNKSERLKDILERLNIEITRVAFMGDDLADLGPLDMVGFPISVPNGRPEATSRALYITKSSGGHGAVREVADIIVTAKSK